MTQYDMALLDGSFLVGYDISGFGMVLHNQGCATELLGGLLRHSEFLDDIMMLCFFSKIHSFKIIIHN